MKAAIVGLVRGQNRIEGYSKLIRRNRLLHRHFNKKYGYPVILFHEGNICDNHQIVLSHLTPNLQFVDVSAKAFNLPSSVEPEWIRDNKHRLGYKHMCRFNALQIWDWVKEFDYVLRLDDDSFIESNIDYDIFKYMEENELDYGYIHTEFDYHEQTVATLPNFTRNYVCKNGVAINCSLEEIDALYYYTNFFVTRVSFWFATEVQAFLSAVDRSNGIYRYRWGDHVIQTHALKMFSSPDKIHYFNDFHYSHGSHRWSNYQVNTVELLRRKLRKMYRRRLEPKYLAFLADRVRQ